MCVFFCAHLKAGSALIPSVFAAKDEFAVLIAHEFFDALPIHIFEVRKLLCRRALFLSGVLCAEHPKRLA